ncbi:hypothetical protein [Acidovorax sp. PRC11]|uniref:hypothetical protein n=1 Tax=Acidovorax sp. PRC11 TaxID=2962592 RepID=UPI00288266A5|nr:hypothetical protein [Acidovorax sp. PRC11]MDT0136217.1 hypothetical protein [Acidovorax sp. PRC11]
MKISNLKNVPCIVWCLGLNMVFLAIWALATPTFLDAENSPHRVYRLEFHQASLLQRIAHPSFKMPYVVRLYRIEPKTLLGQSDVVDLWMNGDIEWQLDPPVQASKVYVGRDVVFKDIPPECINAAQIPSCPNAKP